MAVFRSTLAAVLSSVLNGREGFEVVFRGHRGERVTAAFLPALIFKASTVVCGGVQRVGRDGA